jgi:hypothetical protein
MKTHLVKNGVVVNTIVATVEEAQAAFPGYTCIDGTIGGIGWELDGTELIAPEPEPIPVALGIMATGAWSIPADGETFATVTYTSNDTVYFAVENEIHAIDPVDQIATLEITADAPGPIRIDVKDQRLVIAALEVA